MYAIDGIATESVRHEVAVVFPTVGQISFCGVVMRDESPQSVKVPTCTFELPALTDAKPPGRVQPAIVEQESSLLAMRVQTKQLTVSVVIGPKLTWGVMAADCGMLEYA